MNNLTENQNSILKWVLVALVVAALAFFGVTYPEPGDIPDFPPVEVQVTYPEDMQFFDEQPVALEGDTNFTNVVAEDLTATDDLAVGDDATITGDLDVSGTTTWGITSPTLSDNLTLTGTLTAEDAVITDTLDVNGDIDLDGDGFDVNITAGFSVDGDAASNINVAGAGIDLTLESEAGRVVVKGDEAAANGVYIDANDAAGTGVTIDVGATGGVLISGGPTDIGGGTCGTATGDNDLCVADALEVDGAADLDGTLIVDGATTLNHVSIDDFLTLDPATAISVTAGAVITPVASLQPLTSASAVTCDTTTCIETTGFTTGDVLILRNDNASDTITVDGTGGTVECKADVVLGAADILMLLFDGTDWNCISGYDNS